MVVNELGEIIKKEWFHTAALRLNIELIEDEFVVMPNHIHGIIWINEDNGRGTLHLSLRSGVQKPRQRAPTNYSYFNAVTGTSVAARRAG